VTLACTHMTWGEYAMWCGVGVLAAILFIMLVVLITRVVIR
jgi:hypothetical protein